MNRQEFMKQLEELLDEISSEEREEALAYYRSYFEDAGIENEEKVLRELESPEKLAASIKAGLQEEADERKATEWDQTSFLKEEVAECSRNTGNSSDNTTLLVVSIVLVIVLSPVWIGMLGGVFGLVMGIIGTLLGIAVGFLAGGVACIGIGISYFVVADVPMGLLAFGLGALLAAVGILALLGLVQFCGRFIPWVIRGLVKICRGIFNRKEKEERV